MLRCLEFAMNDRSTIKVAFLQQTVMYQGFKGKAMLMLRLITVNIFVFRLSER